ncbi:MULTISPECIES: cytochrome P450 [unclassified Geodermatophilus]|uniref:cytochrome P450 n=1 Tax=unclassified Geodermatophilus TaxID=2637632 RepID=UPI003EE8E415
MTEATIAAAFQRRCGEFDPDPGLARLREQAGIARVSTPFGCDAWLVMRHADVRRVLSDAQRFSMGLPPDFSRRLADEDISDEDVYRERAGDLLSHDPPEHTRLRKMLSPAFTVHQVRRLQPWIAHIVENHLDAMDRAGPPTDLVQAFALPIPSLVICELLGVPDQDRAHFQRLTRRPLDLTLSPKERTASFRQVRDYMAGLATRARTDPGGRMLAALAREHGDELTTDELAAISHLMLLAGFETTTSMLALGTLALLRHPDQLRVMRDRPEHVDAGVEELLRWLSIVNNTTVRITTEPVEIAGQWIDAGEMVLPCPPAANRDPRLVPDPDVLDLTRGAVGHVAFGHGVHHCLGAPLARAEMRIAFPALLRRFPGLRLAHPPAEVQLRAPGIIHGVTRLPVAW